MRRAIIHIGLNKTGTSSIQNFLGKNRAHLATRGFCYPNLGDGSAAHHAAAAALARGEGDTLRALVMAQMGETDTLLLSSEAFADLDDSAVIARLFADFEVEVVVYVREHLSHLVSWYQQDIQMGSMTCGLDAYGALKTGGFAPRLEAWRRAFGAARMQVAIYDRQMLTAGDSLTDFMARIGLDGWESWPRTPWENNPSVTGNLLFFKKLANCFGDGRQPGIAEEIEELSKLSPRFRGRLHVSAPLAEKIVHRSGADRERLKALYGLAVPVHAGPLDGEPMPFHETLAEDWTLVTEAAQETAPRLSALLAPLKIVEPGSRA